MSFYTNEPELPVAQAYREESGLTIYYSTNNNTYLYEQRPTFT